MVREAVREVEVGSQSAVVAQPMPVEDRRLGAVAQAPQQAERPPLAQLPVRVELPRSMPALPVGARQQVERAVTSVVRERLRAAPPAKPESVPSRVEVRIDQVNVRIENPPAPPAAPAAPAGGGFASYFLARTVSR